MNVLKLPLETTGHFSSLINDYLTESAPLKPFYAYPPTAKAAEQAISQRNFPAERREILLKAIQEQYKDLPISDQLQESLNRLAEPNTFTITTGHQLNIFTGPLYFVYKIITTIQTCRALKQLYPEHNFIPVYWMASEDHDLEEIAHFSLFGKTYQWETQQRGPVGSMNPDGLAALADELPEAVPLFKEAYAKADTLAEAVRNYVNALFGKYGVVVLDADAAELKKLFAPVMQEELLQQTAGKLVAEQSAKLEEAGYKAQVFARDINLFYMKPGLRERIVQEGEHFQVLNTETAFSKEELLQELEVHPDRFSPNVVLRPLYQEYILPNLGYVGGPAELAYWMQLKPVFEHYKTSFPLLLPRHFALVIGLNNHQRLEKLGFSPLALFSGLDNMREALLMRESDTNISLSEEVKALQDVFEAVRQKVLEVDGSLKGFVGAEENKALKSLENIEKRTKKAEERRHETSLRQLDHVYDKLFPNGKLQERSDNFMNFWLNDPGFIDRLLDAFEAFDYRFTILTYEGNES